MLRFGGLSKFSGLYEAVKGFVRVFTAWGDYGLEPASLEAFPQQHYGCDGRANLLCAPIEPFLLRRLPTGGITLLVNPLRTCAARVTVLGLCVCVAVCLSLFSYYIQATTQLMIPTAVVQQALEN